MSSEIPPVDSSAPKYSSNLKPGINLHNRSKERPHRKSSNVLLLLYIVQFYSAKHTQHLPKSIRLSCAPCRRRMDPEHGRDSTVITYQLSRPRSERFLFGCLLRKNTQNEVNNQTDTLAIPLSIRNFRSKTSISREKKNSYKTQNVALLKAEYMVG